MMHLIDGKAIAKRLMRGLADEVAAFKKAYGAAPTLAVLHVGEDPASQVYVGRKQAACKEVGIESILHRLPENATTDQVSHLVGECNQDLQIHGILLQLPLPAHLPTLFLLDQLDPKKDVDGLHPHNAGALMLNQPGLRPCTPNGVIALLDGIGFVLEGKHAVVLGRSPLVGRPLALLLLHRNATVTLCHSKTEQVPNLLKQADLVVAAIGKPRFVRAEWLNPKTTVIDVGIHRLPDGSLCGDVDFEAASQKVAAITPVPGGVGPMTVAMLLANTLQAAKTLMKGDIQ